ncbi:MAG TPA: efflux RND transporter periplasmic adaptor subunit, partial [Gammaproteobacteria bacterium]|nr:efflux RND transporter periplasmic adaptor subunit [Gammaproteobacteria bacterium]
MNDQARLFSAAFRGGVLIAVMAASAQLSGCEPAGSQPQSAAPPPPEVTTVTVEAKDVPVVFEYTGTTAGSREVEVRARVTGIILARNYQEGGHVATGQSLFSIDPEPYQAAVARAEAELASAEARLLQSKRDAQRLKPLYQAKVASQKEFDDAVSAESIADAEVEEARARLTQAKLDLKYTRVESPITGIAGRALRSEG